MQLLLFGPEARALSGVTVRVGDEVFETNAQGAVLTEGPEGAQVVQLEVPREQLPGAPTEEATWRVALSDIPIVVGETTVVIATLGERGAIVGLDIQAPVGGGARSLQREFQKALGEKPKGEVEGRVVAAEGGAPVEGAQIYVRGAPIEAATDHDGRFSLTLPVGAYRLSVIHSRFSTQGVPEVVVEEGKTTTVAVELSPASVELDELVVTAPHIEGGVATLIAERRETTAVADVIGAEQMARSGDSSAASALARVTGLTVVDGKFVVVRGMGERYSSMTLNRLQVPSPEPTRRVVPLDLFPTGVLESMVVQKTYSPDMPGEFGGGVVQLRTRGYPDKLLISVTTGTGINTVTHLQQNNAYDGGRTDFLGIDDGTRELPEGFDDAGKIFLRNRFSAPDEGFTQAEINEYARSLPNIYAVERELTYPDASLTVSFGNRFKLRRAKVGFVAAGGYKNAYSATDSQRVRLVSSAGNELLINDSYLVDSFEHQVSLSAFLDSGVEIGDDHKIKSTTMLLRQTDDTVTVRRGYNDDVARNIERTRLAWVERELLDQQLIGTHVFKPLHRFQLDWRGSYARATRDEPDRRDYQYNEDPGTGIYALTRLPGDNQRLFGFGRDTALQGDVDLTQPISVWADREAKLKVGTMIYHRARESDVRRFEFDVSQQSVAERSLPPERVFGQFLDGTQSFSETTFGNDSYDATVDIQAGYAMVEMPIVESVDLMTGVRLERALIKTSTVDQFAPDKPPEISRLDDRDLLPAATITYRILTDLQLRGGYSRTLNRPDIRELSSSRYYDIQTGAIFQGNPSLKRATIDNFDSRLEWYLSSDETFSLGGFYKIFHDPIESTIQAAVGTLLGFANTDEARIWGLELEGRKRFGFLSPSMDSLYLAGNFAWIDSEVTFALPSGAEASRPLESQSPWVVNLQLGWDDTQGGGTGTAASLLYNVSGERIRFVGDPDDNIPDQYEQPFHRVDFVASQALDHGFKLGFKAQNIFNPVQRWTQGDVLVRRYRRGASLSLAASWSY